MFFLVLNYEYHGRFGQYLKGAYAQVCRVSADSLFPEVYLCYSNVYLCTFIPPLLIASCPFLHVCYSSVLFYKFNLHPQFPSSLVDAGRRGASYVTIIRLILIHTIDDNILDSDQKIILVPLRFKHLTSKIM